MKVVESMQDGCLHTFSAVSLSAFADDPLHPRILVLGTWAAASSGPLLDLNVHRPFTHGVGKNGADVPNRV